jgi:hypothetical protein
MSRSRLSLRSTSSVLSLTLSTLVLLLLLMQSHCVFGQVDEGAITGTVQDPSSAVIPNAQVTLLNTDQGLTLTTTTNGSGVYTFSPVRIGHYSISVAAPGFTTTTQKNLQVDVGQQLQRSPVKRLIICLSMAVTLPFSRSWARARIHPSQTPEAMRPPAPSLLTV